MYRPLPQIAVQTTSVFSLMDIKN